MKPGIDTTLINQILAIILAHKPLDKIVLFGSRCNNNHTENSDIDLAIFGKSWTSSDINIVHFKLEEMIPTALTFDLLLFHELKKQRLIDEINNGIIIYERTKNKRVAD